MAPKVLVSDKLSETAVQIFRDRSIDVDFMPDVGKDKEKLAKIIGQYDGLAIRSATKVTPKILDAADNLKVIGRAGIGADGKDQIDPGRNGVNQVVRTDRYLCMSSKILPAPLTTQVRGSSSTWIGRFVSC